MKNIFGLGALTFLLLSCSSPKENRELLYEIEIIDSIQVDVMERISAIDFNDDQGIVYSYQNNQITLFNTDGEILNRKSYPKEGPGAVGFITDLKMLENGKTLVYPFGTKLPLLDNDLEVEKYYEMPFPPELRGASYFKKMFAVHEDKAFIFFPGRDGGNPYDVDYYKNFKLVEKLNLEDGSAEGVFTIPNQSKYLSDLNYEYPYVTLASGNEKLYLSLDTESFIHIYEPDGNLEAVETLDFSPAKFVQMEGTKDDIVTSYGKMLKGEVKNLYAVPNGVVVYYSQGIEQEVFQQESLHERPNWPKRAYFNQDVLKVYLEDQGWSNEIMVPIQVQLISGVSDVNKNFWGLRNDDVIGEEQDYMTFYKLRFKPIE